MHAPFQPTIESLISPSAVSCRTSIVVTACAAAIFVGVTAASTSCPGDLDNSGVVDSGDLALALLVWETSDTAADLDGDGTVAGSDIGLILTTWGPCLPNLYSLACARTLVADSSARVASAAIQEASGIAASQNHAGVFWVHNDSGDSARIFAVSRTGADLGTWRVPNASALDWEDIAIGPGVSPGTTALYIADIGNNSLARTTVVVYRVAEPDPTTGGGTTANPEVLRLTYSDGPHNAEALLVDPNDGSIVVVTKESSGNAGIYTATPSWGSSVVLTRVGQISLGAGTLVTAGDVAPDGKTIALRTYGSLLVFDRPAATSIATALGGARCLAQVASEQQGEAVAFLADSLGYITVSEGNNPKLNVFSR